MNCIHALTLTALGLLAGDDKNKTSPLDFSGVEAVAVSLEDYDERQKPIEATIRDAGKVKALIDVLRSGKPVNDHKCANSGTLVLRRTGRSDLKVGILAGHDPRFYEFRAYVGPKDHYQIHRVDRGSFLKAMEAGGVKGLDAGLPK